MCAESLALMTDQPDVCPLAKWPDEACIHGHRLGPNKLGLRLRSGVTQPAGFNDGGGLITQTDHPSGHNKKLNVAMSLVAMSIQAVSGQSGQLQP